MSRSSSDFGHVVDRPGNEGVFLLFSNGSQMALVCSVVLGTLKVSPLRIDMFWKQSMSEGVSEGL